MKDCNGSLLQVGDKVVICYQRRSATLLQGKVNRVTPTMCEVEITKGSSFSVEYGENPSNGSLVKITVEHKILKTESRKHDTTPQNII